MYLASRRLPGRFILLIAMRPRASTIFIRCPRCRSFFRKMTSSRLSFLMASLNGFFSFLVTVCWGGKSRSSSISRLFISAAGAFLMLKRPSDTLNSSKTSPSRSRVMGLSLICALRFLQKSKVSRWSSSMYTSFKTRWLNKLKRKCPTSVRVPVVLEMALVISSMAHSCTMGTWNIRKSVVTPTAKTVSVMRRMAATRR